jgi:hypothetical protein
VGYGKRDKGVQENSGSMDLLNLDLHYETDSVSFNPLRRAHRVHDRARKVRPVDHDCCDSDLVVESRGTSATIPCGLAEARPQCVRFQEIVCNFDELSYGPDCRVTLG